MGEFEKVEKIEKVVTTADELARPVIIPAEAYISAEYVRAERERLWTKVWLQAGRVEEIPQVGNYITFEIAGESIVIVRAASFVVMPEMWPVFVCANFSAPTMSM